MYDSLWLLSVLIRRAMEMTKEIARATNVFFNLFSTGFTWITESKDSTNMGFARTHNMFCRQEAMVLQRGGKFSPFIVKWVDLRTLFQKHQMGKFE